MDILVHDMLTLKAMAGSGKVVFSVGGWWRWHATCATHGAMVQSLAEDQGVRLMDKVPRAHRSGFCDACGELLVSAPRGEA